jgi:methionyl-tRNA synthetase
MHPQRYLVTTALPYANGPIHIGHVAGAFLPADIYVRFLRSKKKDVILIGGSDEHGVPITIRARQEGITPKQVVDKYHELNKRNLLDFGISFDIFSRTTNQIHKETSSDFFKTLLEKGLLKEKESEQYYDEEAKQFLADRYIRGKCPKCGYEEAYGDQCEGCGTSLSPGELINPHSYLSGSKPVLKKTKHWYFPLGDYQSWLEKWILEDHKEWKINVYGQCKSWLEQGLKDRAVTRDLDWGVPVPIEDAKGKVLYVWFDAPIGYISATKELAAERGFDWKQYWQDEETKLVHFIGKDNIVFHCVMFPAMLKAHGNFILPDQVPANEFMNLEGDKISTSRNHAVWLDDYLKDFPGQQDVLRYVMCSEMPETKDADFKWETFKNKNNNELVATLGNFVNRVLSLSDRYYDGVIPVVGDLQDLDKNLFDDVNGLIEKVEKNIESFKFKEALNLWMEIARKGNKYMTETEPWKVQKTDPERVKTILNVALQVVAKIAIIGFPFIPFSCEKICKMLNIENLSWDNAKKNEILEAYRKVSKPQILFNKM